MIELNLLPEEVRKKRAKIELPDLPLIPIGAALVGAMVIIQLLLGGLIFLNQKEKARLDKEWEELLPKKVKLDAIKKEISDLGKKVQSIEYLMEKRLNWARLLDELSASLTANIWLTELAYSEKIEKRKTFSSRAQLGGKKAPKAKEESFLIRTLTLSGRASLKGEEAPAYIGRFTEALKANKDFSKHFSEIEPGPIKKGTVEKEEVMNFTVICKFSPEKM